MNKETLVAWYEAGYKPSLQPRHFEVWIYGDAVVVTI